MYIPRVIGLSTLAGLVLAALVWIVIAPVQVGGQTAYMTTNGNSMEPLLEPGELAITRAASDYQVGDVVAYRDPEIGLVLHRIVARDGDRFVTRGDHNGWTDGDHPLPGAVVGKLWIRIPALGRALDGLRTPGRVTVMSALVGITTLAAVRGSRPNRRERRKEDAGLSWLARLPGAVPEIALSVALVAALASLALAFFAFGSPLQHDVNRMSFYDQSGTFDYSALAPPPGVYDANKATTGQPIYLYLAPRMEVRFDYHFNAAAPHSVHGTYGLSLLVSRDDGWQRTVRLLPQTPFSGDSFSAKAIVDLSLLQDSLAQAARQAGVNSPTATVALVPDVHVDGQLAQTSLTTAFSPALRFTLDSAELEMIKPVNGQPDPVHPAETRAAQRSAVEPSWLSILGIHLGVWPARLLSLLGFALSAAVGIVAAALMFRPRAADESVRIQSRYAPLLMNVSGALPAAPEGVVEVDHFEDMAKIARQNGRMILHHDFGHFHSYFVSDGHVGYLYRTRGVPQRAAVLVPSSV